MGNVLRPEDLTPQEGELYAASIESPPGTAGEIASFIYHASPRPVTQVSIAAALGWLAGVCGLGFEVSHTGLNLYIALVAPSGRGKEMLHEGPGLLNKALFSREVTNGSTVVNHIPGAEDFFCFDDFASGAALAKFCASHPTGSFVNYWGEFGHVLAELAKGGAPHIRSLRRVMTNLFHKSGAGSVAGGTRYANEKENAVAVDSVAYSIVGETTPDTFYGAITQSMMSDGFLSRFLTIEYEGKRPSPNLNRILVPPAHLVQHLRGLVVHVQNLRARRIRQPIFLSDYAQRELNSFQDECDEAINATKDEAVAQTWNRAHIKAVRVTALQAAGSRYTDVDGVWANDDEADWAIDLVRRDTARYLSRLANGEIGNDDHTRQLRLLRTMHEFLHNPLAPGYGVPLDMQRDGVVPRKYLQMRVSQMPIFKEHPFGLKRALDDAINTLLDNGAMVEMDKVKAGEAYTFQGRCFRIVQLPNFA